MVAIRLIHFIFQQQVMVYIIVVHNIQPVLHIQVVQEVMELLELK